jgi:molecular chaperone GrpE
MSNEQGTAVDDAPDEEPTADAEESNGETATAEPPIDAIADRIAGEPAAAIAEEIATLREEIADLRTERDDLESRLKRKQAEFQNYKKRQKKRREKQRARATESIVEELLEVRDNLTRALEQDEGTDIREGVEATFRGLEDVLEGQGVEPIEPDPGTDTDPRRHEVLLRVESDAPEGTIAELHRPGYEMADAVLRPAQVTVSEGPPESATEESPETDEAEDTADAAGDDAPDESPSNGNTAE